MTKLEAVIDGRDHCAAALRRAVGDMLPRVERWQQASQDVQDEADVVEFDLD